MIKVGITGSNGFIGWHLCRTLELDTNKFKLIDFHMTSYPGYNNVIARDARRLTEEFFSCDNLLKVLFND